MFDSVLIANRGEVAVRIIRTCRDLGIKTVLAASTVDADGSLAARLADQVVRIGGPRPSESYLNLPALLSTAKATGVAAVHPGFGFLSENSTFSEGCREIGVSFVGPSTSVLEGVGDKVAAREIAAAAGVPISPGCLLTSEVSIDVATALEGHVGYPLMIKAVQGGGGRGMRLVSTPEELMGAVAVASAEASAAFGCPDLYAEHFVPRARHIEVQIVGLADGRILVLGDRDCSVQRRHQKLVEEAPAPALPDDLRQRIHDSARSIGRALGYENAGTVEFVLDVLSGEYYFLEVNARLQVEHPVTEAVTGIDIVRTQFEIASGDALSSLVCDEPSARGVAIECRVNAECPSQGFRPSPGRLTVWRPPNFGGVRLDSHCYGGYVVPPYYDSLLGKVVAFGADRDEAIHNMVRALRSFEVVGVDTTIAWMSELVASPQFRDLEIHTRWVDDERAMLPG